jgi:hypothetical protein
MSRHLGTAPGRDPQQSSGAAAQLHQLPAPSRTSLRHPPAAASRRDPVLAGDEVYDMLGAFDSAVALLRRIGQGTEVVANDEGVIVALDAETWALVRALAGATP